MTRFPRLVALLAGATATVAVSGCGISFQSLPQLGSAGAFSGYRLNAEFDNVQNLAINAKVRYGDAVIGDVTGISAKDFHALLTLKIKKGVQLPAGTKAQVVFETPLGDEYVELTPPSGRTGPPIRPGTTIGLADTTDAPTVADTLAALGAVLYGSGLGQGRVVVDSLNQILGGNGQQIQHLVANVNTVLGSLSANDTHIDAALASASAIFTEINSGRGAVAEALDTLPQAAAAISADNAQLQQLLTGVQQLSPVVTDVLGESGQNLVADVSDAVPILQSLQTVAARFGTDSADFTKFATAIEKEIPNDYVHLNVNFTAAFPNAEPVPSPLPLVGCTDPTPPSECPPGTSLTRLFTAALP